MKSSKRSLGLTLVSTIMLTVAQLSNAYTFSQYPVTMINKCTAPHTYAFWVNYPHSPGTNILKTGTINVGETVSFNGSSPYTIEGNQVINATIQHVGGIWRGCYQVTPGDQLVLQDDYAGRCYIPCPESDGD